MASSDSLAAHVSDAECDRAIDAIEAELSVVLGSVERVESACAFLRHAGVAWTARRRQERLRRLVLLANTRVTPAARQVIGLVREAATASRDPWALLEGLLQSNDPGVPSLVLDDAVTLAARGSLVVDGHVAATLAAAVEREGTALTQPESLQKISRLLQHLSPAAANQPSPLVTLLTSACDNAVRRLAARVLDLDGAPPVPDLVRLLLGAEAAALLQPYLAYTSAGHLDLVDLLAGRAEPPLVESLPEVEQRLGHALTRDVIASFGWSRTNLGLDVRSWAGISLDESFPFLVTPAEAHLFDDVPSARRVFDRVVVIGLGGAAAEPGESTQPSSTSSGDGPRGDGADVIRRFRAYNLRHAEVLGHILDIAPLSRERVTTILEVMDGITADFASLFSARSNEADGLADLYNGLKVRILGELDGVPAGQPLSAELTRLVQMFEDPPTLRDVRTLHGLKRFLHQRGLALGFRLLEAGHATNRTVDLAVASAERVMQVARRIEYIDFEQASGAGAGDALPYAVSVVVEGVARQLVLGDQQPLPAVKVFCYGNEVHYYVTFRNHPAFIRIDYSPPLSGGMIDLQYYGVSKYELDDHPNPTLDAIQAFFRRLEFDVDVQNTRIHARYDKERALSLADICDKAEALFRLVPYLMDVDWTIGQLALSPGARRQVSEAWADFFAGWGTLPVRELLTADRCGILVARAPQLEAMREIAWTGEGPYRDRFTGRPGVSALAAIREVVTAHHLLPVRLPEHAGGAAQMPLEQHLLRPLRAAVARGEIVETAGGLARAPTDVFERLSAPRFFARLLDADDELLQRAARLATLVGALERSLRFDNVGSVDGYDVQHARLDLRGETLAIYALRDAAGIVRLACYAPDGVLAARRGSAAEPWRENASTDVQALALRLRRNNILPAWVDAPATNAPMEGAALRALFGSPNARASTRPQPGDRVTTGVSASPGRAVGLARLGTAGRDPLDLEGDVLIAPTISPDDSAFLFRAAGVVCTGGGILSHAGLLAVQFGRPALIVDGTWEPGPRRDTWLVFRRTEFEEADTRVGARHVVERRAVKECDDCVRDGDLVELDAGTATLRVLGQDASALALHEDLRQLDEADILLARSAGDAEVLVQRGRRLRALHQLEKLLARLDDPVLARHAARQLLAGVTAGRRIGGEREHARLLEVLLRNSSVAPVVRGHVAELRGELRLRCATAADAARRLIPVSSSAVEVLGLRLAALRACDALRAGLTACAADTAAKAAAADIDLRDVEALAIDQAERIWRRLLERNAARTTLARPCMRHDVRQLLRLADVLPVTDDDRRELDRLFDALGRADAAVTAALADRYVLWPHDGGLELQPLVGWKTANLAEVERLGERHLVPSWFAVSDRAFRDVLASPVRTSTGMPAPQGTATLGDAIGAILERRDATNAEKSSAIRRLWDAVALPEPLEREIVSAYRQLALPDVSRGVDWRIDVPDEQGLPYVAIRSSAKEEDTEGAVRAGEFETYLFIRGDAAVIEHVKRAWSGLWTERAVHNRAVLGASASGEGGGVLVQRIVWSRVSGVLQTENVVTGQYREMVINAGLGMGEGVVSGVVGADHIVVAKEDDMAATPLRFRYITCDKRQRVVFDARAGRGTLRQDTVSHQRFRPALEYIELLELVQLAARLDSIYGYPLDIEFGVEGAQLRILQVRPTPGSLAPWRETLERYPLVREARPS